ncbi:MAG TPA: hypothetical protein VNE61_03885 [Ktedonobacteraceae bacterium]|nr:hypothetical protein [Ktedonobacteraceae bacterium]
MPLKAAYQDYYTAAQAKQVMSITDGMLYNFIRNGDIEPVKLPGRKHSVYKRDQIDKLARELKEFTPRKTAKPTKFVRATKEDLVTIMEISDILFGAGRSVTPLEKRITWLEKNPDTYHVLKQGNQVVGYVSILPLKANSPKMKPLLGGTTAVDITPDDIVEFEEGVHTDFYVMSIGVKPTESINEKHTYGSSLIRGLRQILIELGRKGVIIETIAARSDTPDGIRVLRHTGFTEIEPLLPGKRAFIISVPESGVPLIMEYKQALRESDQAKFDSVIDSKDGRKAETTTNDYGQHYRKKPLATPIEQG